MDDFIFREKDHTYLLQGEPIPCVSDLCRFLHREIYKDAPAWQMEVAAARGTAVHAATELLDKTGTAEIDGEYAPYLQAYAAFLREHSVQWSMIEKPFYHPEDLYAGTIDRYGLLDDEETLVDVKTTYTVHKPLTKAQLNLYRRMLEARGWPVKRLFILHLKKDGTYRLVSTEVDDDLPDAILTLHRATQKRRRKRKQ